ncbi:SagB/ThcOx family dehydrogenase, partial [bacterium]
LYSILLGDEKMNVKKFIIELPNPVFQSQISVEEALVKRRSIRSYKNEPLTIKEISQILWAAQGITNTRGFRTAPSAGALYPLELYILIGNVLELNSGVYKYIPHGHKLEKILDQDKRDDLCSAALGQESIIHGAVVLVFSAVYSRIMRKYRERGRQYAHIEIGHSAQNVFLQTVSLNLAAVVIGAFDDNHVKKAVNMNDEETPLYIMPIGKKIN